MSCSVNDVFSMIECLMSNSREQIIGVSNSLAGLLSNPPYGITFFALVVGIFLVLQIIDFIADGNFIVFFVEAAKKILLASLLLYVLSNWGSLGIPTMVDNVANSIANAAIGGDPVNTIVTSSDKLGRALKRDFSSDGIIKLIGNLLSGSSGGSKTSEQPNGDFSWMDE